MLLLAVEQGNTEIVKILLQLGIKETSLDNIVNAQTLALKGHYYDVIHILLENNLEFPKSLNVDKCTGKLKEFCELTDEVHKLIKLNERQKLANILDMHKNLHHFYNFSNESALKVAILSKSFEVFDILLQKKFRFGSHEDPAKCYEKLGEGSKRIVRDIQHKHSQAFLEKHIHTFVSNSTACFDEAKAEDKLGNVQRAFKILSENYLIRIILMIIAASKNFKIVFDFNREAVNIIDPTTTKATQGIFYLSGKIFIGAKQLLNPATEHETLAVLAHELCHFAMNIVYKNRANPYKSNDKKQMDVFEDVLIDCIEHSDKEEVISSVYNCYSDEDHHAELIVRVVHLLALYRNSPDKLAEVRSYFKSLFEFYETKVVPDLEKALPELEDRDEKQLKDKDKKIIKLIKVLISITILSIIAIVSGVHITLLTLHKPVYKFQDLSFIDQMKLQNAPVIYKNVTISFYDLFLDNSSVNFNLRSDHIAQMLNDVPLNFDDPNLRYLDEIVYHSWENLTEKLKRKVMKTNFIFQNESLKFQDLGEISDMVLNSTNSGQILDILNGKELNVHKMIANDSKFYVERKVFKENFWSIHLNFEDIIKIAEESKIFILSANAGTGKTVTFKQFTIRIKKNFPNRWVSYIDLKDYKEWFNSVRTFEDVRKMLESIFSLNSDEEFKIAVLEESFKSGNTILLWNGFDEISPDYSESVLRIFTLIKENSENIQFVCTRPVFSEILKNTLNSTIYNLVPFTPQDRKNFIIEYSNSEKSGNVDDSKLDQKIQKIVNLSSLREDFDTPLLLLVIGELITSNIEVNDTENLYEIYQKFVVKKVEIWRQKFEFATVYFRDSMTKDKHFVMMKHYQFYALKSELEKREDKIPYLCLLKLKSLRQNIPEKLTKYEISRMSILYFNDQNNFEFVHRTFIEFFIAQFFIENIYNDDDDLSIFEAELMLNLLYTLSNQQGISKFIDDYFQDQSKNKIFVINSGISQALKGKFRDIFTDMIHSYRFEDLGLFLNYFRRDRQLISEILDVDQKETFYTGSFDNFHTRPFPVLFDHFKLRDLMKEYLTDQNVEKFILGENQKGIVLFGLYKAHYSSPLSHTYSNKMISLDSDILTCNTSLQAYEIISRNITQIELKELLTSKLIFDLKTSNSEYFDTIWSQIESTLSNQDLKSHITNMLTQFSILDFKDSRDFFLSKMEKQFTDSEIVEIFFKENLLHLAISTWDGFTDMWNFFVAHSSQDDQKLILKQKYQIKCYSHCHFWKTIYSYTVKCSQLPFLNILQFAVASISSCSDSYDEITDIYESIFNKSEIQTIISNSSNFLSLLIVQNRFDKCENFANYLRKIYAGNQTLLVGILKPKKISKHKDIFEVFKDKSNCIKYFSDLIK